MTKLAVVVGTRPEIVKMAPVVRACRARRVPFVLIHTGQHYSFEMDGVFFADLGLPTPRHNLQVGSGSHALQIARVIERMEPLLREERPDAVLVQGDTNSVVAAALAADKLGIPVGHVEAGLRSYDRRMPEETNRIVADHLATWNFAPTRGAARTLRGEGIPASRILVTGNTVVDELRRQRARAERSLRLGRLGVEAGRYAVATVHRPENVEDAKKLRGVFAGLARAARALAIPVLVPLHPRTRARLESAGIELDDRLRVLPPLGYLEFLGLQSRAALLLTDSGGVQEEACCLGVPCVTLRDSTERPETIDVGANELAGSTPVRIVAAARRMAARRRRWRNPFGDGKAGLRIVDGLLRALRRPGRRALAARWRRR